MASSPPLLDIFRIASPSPFSITVLVASPLFRALGFRLLGLTAARPRPLRLLLFSELRHSAVTGLRTGSPSRGRHLRALTRLVGAAGVGLPNPRSLVGAALRAIPLILLTPAARVVPCLFPSGQVLVRRSEDRLPRLQRGGLAAAVLIPGLPPRGSGSLHQSPASNPSGCVPGWARGPTGFTEGSVCFVARSNWAS